MMAFCNCAENPGFSIDVFEFDLHITADDHLVLLHDDTLDRTSDSEKVFGEKNARPEDKTLAELSWEQTFARHTMDGARDVALPPDLFNRLAANLAGQLNKAAEMGAHPAIVTSTLRRRFLRTVLGPARHGSIIGRWTTVGVRSGSSSRWSVPW